MVLIDLYYDSGEKEVLFVKIGARVPDLWLNTVMPGEFNLLDDFNNLLICWTGNTRNVFIVP